MVSKVTGFASKVLPGPLGAAAGAVSKVTGGISNSLTAAKSAQAALFPKASASATVGGGGGAQAAAQAAAISGKGTIGNTTISTGQKFPVWGWIAIGVGFVLALFALFGRRRKR